MELTQGYWNIVSLDFYSGIGVAFLILTQIEYHRIFMYIEELLAMSLGRVKILSLIC
jgi:hypothetical protein